MEIKRWGQIDGLTPASKRYRIDSFDIEVRIYRTKGEIIVNIHHKNFTWTVLHPPNTRLATHEAGAELAAGREQVEVVAAGVVLGHGRDGSVEGRLAVVVGRVLRHVPRQLDHLPGRTASTINYNGHSNSVVKAHPGRSKTLQETS